MDDNDLPDDPTISDQAALWRRIPPMHIVADEESGKLVISSAAFMDDADGHPMSIILGTRPGDRKEIQGCEASRSRRGLMGYLAIH